MELDVAELARILAGLRLMRAAADADATDVNRAVASVESPKEPQHFVGHGRTPYRLESKFRYGFSDGIPQMVELPQHC